VKPVPPTDLWDKLAAFNTAYVRPEGSFTVIEYCTRFNIDDSVARRRMMTLVKAGKLQKTGKYYVIVEDNDGSSPE